MFSSGEESSPSLLHSSSSSPIHVLPRRRSSVTASNGPSDTVPETDRKVASTLHIMKISPPVSDIRNEDARRITGREDIQSTPGSGSNRRISFAGSSFGPPTFHEVRQHPPLYTRRNSVSSHMCHENKLTPNQVYQLADQCKRPISPVETSLSSINFAPLPKNHYLPFIDRPSEVKELLERPETRRLFLLLAQAFPREDSFRVPTWDIPSSWSYAQLEQWLTTTTREEMDDIRWTQKAGACISSRSEVIWEKVKEVLGIPPELEEQCQGINDKIVDEFRASDADDGFEEVWVEPIVAIPGESPCLAISTHLDHTPKPFRPACQTNQGLNRMHRISEDVLDSKDDSSILHTVDGLRIGNCSSPLLPRFPAHNVPERRRRYTTSHMFPPNFSDLAQ